MGLNNDVTLKVGFDIDKFHSDLKASNQRLESWASGVTKIFGSIAILGTLKSVGSQMIDVTAQFQKFGAVLGNTLGSSSEAQKALNQIRQFAVQTPFEVSEITSAYVRWANMGLDPTIERMGKLGDVASSLGAGFEQTAEAFKDLMVGQTKRIEEVGIGATQTNGKIQLSFKGVNLEIEKNAAGVQKALDVYSQLNGVLGTSEAISNTLGGKISNLSDAWSNFLLSMGNASGGLITSVVSGLTNLLNDLSGGNDTIYSIKTIVSSIDAGQIEVIRKNFDGLRNSMNEMSISEKQLMTIIQEGNYKNADTFERAKKVLQELGVEITGINQIALGPSKDILAPPPGKTEWMNKMTEAIQRQAKALEEYWKARKAPLNTMFVSGGSLKDSGALPDLISQGMASQKVEGLPGKVGAPFNVQELVKNRESLNAAAAEYQKLIQKINEDYAEMAQVTINTGQLLGNGIQMIADAMYQSMSGTISFGQAILKGLSAFMKSFGEQLIAMGAGAIALEELSINPYVAIAAGLALTALAGAVKSTLSDSATGAMKGGSSSYRTSLSGSSQNMNITVNGRLYGEGATLVAVIDNANMANQYTRGN